MNVRVLTGAGFKEMFEYLVELTQNEKHEDLLLTYIVMHMPFNIFADRNTVLTKDSEQFKIQMGYLNKIIALAPAFFHMSWNGPAEAKQWYPKEVLENSEEAWHECHGELMKP